jgi:hypothetical protein
MTKQALNCLLGQMVRVEDDQPGLADARWG